MTLCVYAIVPAPVARLSFKGLGGERPRAVTVGRVAAIAGDLRRQPKPTIRNLRRYAGVVESIGHRVPSILPARFGSFLTSLEELRFVLESRQADLRRRLRDVRGRVQMTVRIVQARTDVAAPLTAAHLTGAARPTRGSAARRGTEYMRQRAAVAGAREVPGFGPIRAAVTRWVKDERVDQRGSIATVDHLIPRSGVAAYCAALQRAADGARVRLVITGPHPPYTFAQDW